MLIVMLLRDQKGRDHYAGSTEGYRSRPSLRTVPEALSESSGRDTVLDDFIVLHGEVWLEFIGRILGV